MFETTRTHSGNNPMYRLKYALMSLDKLTAPIRNNGIILSAVEDRKAYATITAGRPDLAGKFVLTTSGTSALAMDTQGRYWLFANDRGYIVPYDIMASIMPGMPRVSRPGWEGAHK